MKSEVITQMMREIPLKTRLKVTNQMFFIDLLTELGYREGMWTEEEDEKLKKLCKLAEKLAKHQVKEINEWIEDGKPA